MNSSNRNLLKICIDSVNLAHDILENLGDKGTKEVHDSKVVDISTEGDRAISNAIINFLKEKKVPAILYTEEFGMTRLSDNPIYIITFDDIDGTDNYHRARKSLPHCSLISIFDSVTPSFENVIAAAVIEHNSKNIWHALRGEGTYLNNKKVTTSNKKSLDRKTLVMIDHYMGAYDIPRFLEIYKKSWVKDLGSAAFVLSGISSGMIDAYINTQQKAHELGAGYLFIKEAGGAVIDFEGKSINKTKYDFDAKYEIIASSTKELSEEIKKLIR